MRQNKNRDPAQKLWDIYDLILYYTSFTECISILIRLLDHQLNHPRDWSRISSKSPHHSAPDYNCMYSSYIYYSVLSYP